jgi:hypothetical protein
MQDDQNNKYFIKVYLNLLNFSPHVQLIMQWAVSVFYSGFVFVRDMQVSNEHLIISNDKRRKKEAAHAVGHTF